MPCTAQTQCMGRWGLVATPPTGSPLLRPWHINPTLHLQGSLIPSVHVQSLCYLQKLLRFAWHCRSVTISQHHQEMTGSWSIWTATISLDILYLSTALALFSELSFLEDNSSGVLKLSCFCYSIFYLFFFFFNVKRRSASCNVHTELISIFVAIILFLMLLTQEHTVVQKHKTASSCSIWIFLQCYVNIYK